MSGLLAPRMLGAHVLALVLVAVAAGLGFWQLGAWSAEREQQAVDLTQEPPVPLGEAMTPDDGFPTAALGRPVEVTGAWQPDESLVVAGRSTDTEQPGEGWWAVTPVTVTGADADLLVVRGWAADVGDLPAAPSGEAELVARLQPSQADAGVADTDPADRELPALRIPAAVQLTDANLYAGYAVAAEPQPGLSAVEVPANAEVGPLTAVQNLLYAVEWWIFGGFAAFVWWRFTRDALLAHRAVEAEPAGAGPTPAPVGSST